MSLYTDLLALVPTTTLESVLAELTTCIEQGTVISFDEQSLYDVLNNKYGRTNSRRVDNSALIQKLWLSTVQCDKPAEEQEVVQPIIKKRRVRPV